MKTLEYTAGAEDTGRRIDAALAAAFPELTRIFAQQLLAEGRVLCNGRSVAKSARLTQGDALCVSLPDAQPVEIIPQDIPLDIVYEDSSLLVVNKPKGMVVHPAAGNPDGTLVNALLYHCAGRLSGINGEVRPGIVHRIDKDTSGLLVVAKDNETHLSLSQPYCGIRRFCCGRRICGGEHRSSSCGPKAYGRRAKGRQSRLYGLPCGGALSRLYTSFRKAPDWANPSDPRTSCEHRPSGCRGCGLRPA